MNAACCGAASPGLSQVRTLTEFEQTLGGPRRPLIIDVCHGLGISTLPNRLASRVRKVFDSGLRAVSVGLPLGWDSGEASPQAQAVEALTPHALISLGLPWVEVADFKGRHYLTGRFMCKSLTGLRLPPYPGTAQFVELTSSQQVSKIMPCLPLVTWRPFPRGTGAVPTLRPPTVTRICMCVGVGVRVALLPRQVVLGKVDQVALAG